MLMIAICDDDKELCEWMKQIFIKDEEQITDEYTLDVYYSGAELCKNMEQGISYGLILLDIELNEPYKIDGVSVGKYIRESIRDFEVRIVYISYKTEYAMELLQNQPFDFLVKPLEEDRLL